MNRILPVLSISQSRRLEQGNSITNSETNGTISFLNSNIRHVFTCYQPVAIDMCNKSVFIGLILPYTHRRTTPQITKVILHNATNNLTCQNLCSRIRYKVPSFAVIKKKSRICASQNPMSRIFIKRSYTLTLQLHLPAIGSKEIILRIIATQI